MRMFFVEVRLNMALAYINMMLLENAKESLYVALKCVIDHFGCNSVVLARCLGLDAVLRQREGDFSKAEKLYVKAISIFEKHCHEVIITKLLLICMHY